MFADAAIEVAAALLRQARLGDVEACKAILSTVLAKPEKTEQGG